MDAAQVRGTNDDNVGARPKPAIRRRVTAALASTLGRRLTVGAFLAFLALNLTTMRPSYGIDSSFRVGLTDALTQGIHFGDGIAWPYGPLGFLGGPTFLARDQFVVAILYQLVVMTIVFAVLVDQLTRAGWRQLYAVAALVLVAVAISVTDNIVPEMVGLGALVALAVWHQRVANGEPEVLPSRLVFAAAGAMGGLQLMVKFGPGALLCAGVLGFAALCRPRLRTVAVAAAAMLIGFLAGWLATGQRLGDIGSWVSQSLDLSSGYQIGQAYGPDTTSLAAAGALLFLLVAVPVLGAYRWFRNSGRIAILPTTIIAVAVWFALKQGLVRWDRWHVLGAYLTVGLLALAFPWERRYRVFPIAFLTVAGLLGIAAEKGRLVDTWKDRVDALGVLVSSSTYDSEIAEAKGSVNAVYALPPAVVETLRGRAVHAEQWDISALWGEDLDWRPLPNIQTYSTYTSTMDDLNRDELESPTGPDAVLFNESTVDFRYGPWEGPATRVAMTCTFEVAAMESPWAAWLRAPGICATPTSLGDITVTAGETFEIPAPSSPDSLVVARFDLSTDILRAAVSTIARPYDYPYVQIDGVEYRFVTGTAEGLHLVASPGTFDGRDLPHGEISMSTMSFTNIGGDITVHFEEIPLVAG